MPSDKERLDWLLRAKNMVLCHHGKSDYRCICGDIGYEYFGPTPRKAIDAAMKGEAK